MKTHRIGLPAAFLAAIWLTACGRLDSPILPQRPDESTTSAQQNSNLQNAAPTGDEDDRPPREGLAHSRLTNEWVEQSVADTRPIAVIIPNEKRAVPQYSLSRASVLYEAGVEGQMTRLMAIYEDWAQLEKIGNIRSLRAYYAYWAFEWDAFLVHVGGPFFINDILSREETENIDETDNPGSKAFFRSPDRSVPHNAYSSGSMLLGAIRRCGYPLAYRGLAQERHYRFAPMQSPNTLEQYAGAAQNASYIDMSGCYPLTRCYFEYSEADGLYYRSQHLSGTSDGPHIDAATGEQLSFKNVLVQYIRAEDMGFKEGYLSLQCQDSSMDGWFFTNGKGIHVTWEKTSDYGATRYYDDAGNEIALNTGKTMICVVKEGDSFSFR